MAVAVAVAGAVAGAVVGAAPRVTRQRLAPACASASAHALPMPRDAPVMSTFLPVSEKSWGEGTSGVAPAAGMVARSRKAVGELAPPRLP